MKKAKGMRDYVGIVDINENSLASKYADINFKASLKNKEEVSL